MYYYLVSSLPVLKRDEAPFYSLAAFMGLCSDWITELEYLLLDKLNLVPVSLSESGFPYSSVAAEWYKWEICLRNRIARARSGILGREAGAFVLETEENFTEIDKLVQEVFLIADPLEREKALDNIRWYKAEELEFGHDFDFAKLCVYKIKLMLREKWTERVKEKGVKNLNDIINNVYAG